ncbi:MAG: hypothetical protein ACFFBD_27065 [Candidatus Hodarchaeota archaeon]
MLPVRVSKDHDIKDIPIVFPLIEGRIFPSGEEKKIGVAAKLVVKAITLSTGVSSMKVEEEWKKTGDLGIVAKNLRSLKIKLLYSQNRLMLILYWKH